MLANKGNKMEIFSSENEMQDWLESKFINMWGLSDIITNGDYIKSFTATNLSEKKIQDSFEISYGCLHLLELITANKNISSKAGEILKPDLVTYSPEQETIVIIELKNFSGATREAGTEISAYSAELKGSLHSLPDGDIVSVIISPTWPTLIKHYIYNTIVFQNKNLLCLEPCIVNGEIMLKIADIQSFVQSSLPEKYNNDQLVGYTICLYDDTQQAEDPPPTKLHNHIQVMFSSMDVIAAKGEKINGHGFAFLSKEIYGFGLSPYFISVVNVAPFKYLEQIVHLEDIKHYSDLPFALQKYFDIYMRHTPLGYGSSLSSICQASIPLLKTVCSPHIESLTTWDEISRHLTQLWEPMYFVSWGIFNDVAVSTLNDEYSAGKTQRNLNSPSLGFEVVQKLMDTHHNYIELSYMPESFFPDGYFDEE